MIDLKERVSKVEANHTEMKEHIMGLSNKVTNLKELCPLDSYKAEMRERCERFTEKIESNELNNTQTRHDVENAIKDSNLVCFERVKGVRTLVGRVITALIGIGIFYGGIIGTLQNNKVSIGEYNNHLAAYQIDRSEQIQRFNKFLESYSVDREKRDGKIDEMFEKQLDFNASIIRQNSLLEKQLEVVRTKLDYKK